MAVFWPCFDLNQTARLPVFAESRAVVCYKDTEKLAELEEGNYRVYSVRPAKRIPGGANAPQ